MAFLRATQGRGRVRDSEAGADMPLMVLDQHGSGCAPVWWGVLDLHSPRLVQCSVTACWALRWKRYIGAERLQAVGVWHTQGGRHAAA